MSVTKSGRKRVERWFEQHLSAETGAPVSVGLSSTNGYPTSTFRVHLSTMLTFDRFDDGRMDNPEVERIASALTAAFDHRLAVAGERIELSDISADDTWSAGRRFVLAHSFPPLGISTKSDDEASRYGRWMTDAEVEAWVTEHGDPPFSDERWIETHYAGINVFRGGVVTGVGE